MCCVHCDELGGQRRQNTVNLKLQHSPRALGVPQMKAPVLPKWFKRVMAGMSWPGEGEKLT